MEYPTLEFHLQLPTFSSPHLQRGYLLIKEHLTSAGIKLAATSGCRGNQFQRSWNLKGRGPLPPSKAIAPKRYSVSTQRLWLPQVRGVEGSFYAIAPFSLRLDGGIHRGDFGIHFDANAPGSAGCIVLLLQEHWDVVRELMAEFRLDGHQQIPLEVVYS